MIPGSNEDTFGTTDFKRFMGILIPLLRVRYNVRPQDI
jgi:hypothetical protein